MNVKEILERLNLELEKPVTFDDLFEMLDGNVDADEVTLETEVGPRMIDRLSKYFDVNITKAYRPKAKPQEAPKPKVEPQPEQPKVKVEPKLESKPKVAPQPEPQLQPQPQKQAKPAPKPEPKKAPVETPTTEDIIKEIEAKEFYAEKYQDLDPTRRVHVRIKNVKKSNRPRGGRKSNIQEVESKERVLYYVENMTVANIADGLNKSIGDIVRQLINMGYMVSASQPVDRDTVELLALEYNFELKNAEEVDITKFEQMAIVDDPKDLVERPPIVTIMGHVDHGKTTLLDTIRNTHVTKGEAGGITQHIGAYQITHNGKKITFIDTPGHAAFTEMRSRGAQVTDIVVLVVAADDGVMPQTREAIEHARAAKVPIIVAVNKMDKPQANPDRVIQELANLNLLAESWGGDTIFVPISALKGTNVSELLDNILLVSEMQELKANPNRLGIGTVIEARVDHGLGVVATLLVSNGSLRVGDPIVVGNTYGKIRTMSDENNKRLKVAHPSKAVEITGLSDCPQAGDHFMVFDDEKTARLVAEDRKRRASDLELGHAPVSLASLFEANKAETLRLIIKADVQGSVEALRSSLEQLNVEGIKVEILRGDVGTITETDISFAVASGAIVVGFNVRPNALVTDLAREKMIEIRLYNVIYKLLEDIEAAMKGLLDPIYEEKVIGEAEVRQLFKASKIGTIAGSFVTSGVINRSCHIRLIRDGIVVYEGQLSSLKRYDDDVKEVKQGYDCGMTIANFNDIKVGDIIEGYIMVEVER